MLHFQSTEIPGSVVNALFEDKAISFSLMDGATFADLADSFARLANGNTGVPYAVYMTLGSTGQPVSALASGI
jgi:hypothetical protein